MNLPKEKGYQKLTIYQKAKELVLLVYQLTKKFIRFITIAVSSLTELEIYSHLINDLEYTSLAESKNLQNSILEMKKLLYSSKYSLEKRVKR